MIEDLGRQHRFRVALEYDESGVVENILISGIREREEMANDSAAICIVGGQRAHGAQPAL